MISKMTVEELRKIKNEINALFERFEEIANEHFGEEGYDEEKIISDFLREYSVLLNQLQSHDLSDIPFEEWKGVHLLSDESHPIDFSKTRANLDFSLVNFEGYGNFRGCKIRNLGEVALYLKNMELDEEAIKDNQDDLLSDAFSFAFKDDFYAKRVTIEDLIELSDSQLEELKQKKS